MRLCSRVLRSLSATVVSLLLVIKLPYIMLMTKVDTMQEMAPNTNALQTSMGMTRQSLKRVTQTRKMPSNSSTLAMCRMGRIINNIGTQSRNAKNAVAR